MKKAGPATRMYETLIGISGGLTTPAALRRAARHAAGDVSPAEIAAMDAAVGIRDSAREADVRVKLWDYPPTLPSTAPLLRIGVHPHKLFVDRAQEGELLRLLLERAIQRRKEQGDE